MAGKIRLIYFKLSLTAIFWGGTFIAGRIVAQHVDAYSAAFWRFAIAVGVLFLVVWKVEGRLPALNKRQFVAVFLLGLSGIFTYNVLFFKGLKLIQASRASLIVAINPIFITLFSAYFFKEKLTFLKSVGIVLSVLGAVEVISRGQIEQLVRGSFGVGEWFILGCVFSWVAYSLIGKALMKNLSPLVAVAYSSAIGVATLFVPAAREGVFYTAGNLSAVDWLGLGYLGIFGTVLGFFWYYEGVSTIGPARASQFINLVPVSAILLAFLLLGEAITLSLAVGALFVTGGIYLTSRNSNQENKTFKSRNLT